jgi:hypothetical protein
VSQSQDHLPFGELKNSRKLRVLTIDDHEFFVKILRLLQGQFTKINARWN